MADVFKITSDSDIEINGSDTVRFGIALTTTGGNVDIKTTSGTSVDDGNTITVSEAGSITTEGTFAYE